MSYGYKPQYRSQSSTPAAPYKPGIQYIVEYRPCANGEEYLFTQKDIRAVTRKGPAVLKRCDSGAGYSEESLKESPSIMITIRPVVVGTIDPENGIIIYYADQREG